MNISSRLHSWKRITTAVQCLEQCLVSKGFAKGLNNLNKSNCEGCERKLFHVGVSRFPRLSLTWDVSLSSAHCSWQFCQQDDNAMTDQSTWVGGRGFVITVIAGVGEPAPLTTPSQVQLRPEGGEQLRLSGLASNAAQLHHGGTGYQHPRPSHRGLDLDKKAVLGQLGHREYWFAERASEHVGSVEEWEDYVGGWLSFKFCRQVGHLMSILHFLHELLHIEEQNAYFPQFWPLIRSN